MKTIPIKPVVSLENVAIERQGHTIIEHLSLTITSGSSVAILGSNGSGKSTLLELILGTLAPSSGTVKRAASAFAYVPQRTELRLTLPLTVRDAVMMGRWGSLGPWRRTSRADREIVAEQLDRLGLTEVAHRQLSTLSGGQRQRAYLAQALAQEAPVLLLDEPEAGLDTMAKEIIRNVLKEEHVRGTTIIFATHELDTARTATRCVLLSGSAHGIIADGTPEEILTDAVLAKTFGGGHVH